MMRLIIYIRPTAELDRIVGYIRELPRKTDWEDVIDHIEKEGE